MKAFLSTITCSLLAITCFAQAPAAFNYQGVARDLSGTPIANQSISLKISILRGSATGVSM